MTGEMVRLGDVLASADVDLDIASIERDAERMIVSQSACHQEAFTAALSVGLEARHFRVREFRDAWTAMTSIAKRGDEVSIVTLHDELVATGARESAHRVHRIIGDIPTTVGAEAHARIVIDNAVARWGRELLRKCGARLEKGERWGDVAPSIESGILHLRGSKPPDERSFDVDLMKEVLEHVTSSGPRRGHPMPFASLAGIRLEPGGMSVIAGRPSMGKSAFAFALALNLAENGVGVGILALESDRIRIAARMASMLSGVSQQDARRPGYEASQYVESLGVLEHLPITIRQGLREPGAGEVVAAFERMHATHGCEVVILDHFHKCKSFERGRREDQVLGEISNAVSQWGLSRGVHVIVVAQLNREVEKRPDKRPTMADLRECGALEQDADVIIMLYRPEYYLKDKTPEDQRGIAEAIVMKNREFESGYAARLRWDGSCTRFSDDDEWLGRRAA